MSQQIVNELKSLREVIGRLIGPPDPGVEPFSHPHLEKAAKQYQKLLIERGEWVEENSIDKYIKKASYRAGRFIREELGFTVYFKRGSQYYFYKEHLLMLAQEFKERNVDLSRLIELKEDQQRFEKQFASLKDQIKSKNRRKGYTIPDYVRDVITSPPRLPDVEVVRKDLDDLKQQFFSEKLSEYIDIYKGNYAMTKHLYPYRRYIPKDKLRTVRTWIDHFNIASRVIEEITKKKENFIPEPPDDMIQL